MSQQALSETQFGRHAANCWTSPVHATGADLVRLTATAAHERPARVLGLGGGGGHASFALSRGGAGRVTAYDPSSEMLALVAEEAAKRGEKAIETCVGVAEMLPFQDDTFDLVVTRYSAHHWATVTRALAECARVIAPGGRFIVIDVVAPERPLLDTTLQVIEFLRDASHVRDYRLAEWVAMQRAAGFAEPTVSCWKLPLEFKSWVARIATMPPRVTALQMVFAELPGEARECFQVGPEFSFITDSAWIDARKIG